jgi:hypothetical protein
MFSVALRPSHCDEPYPRKDANPAPAKSEIIGTDLFGRPIKAPIRGMQMPLIDTVDHEKARKEEQEKEWKKRRPGESAAEHKARLHWSSPEIVKNNLDLPFGEKFSIAPIPEGQWPSVATHRLRDLVRVAAVPIFENRRIVRSQALGKDVIMSKGGMLHAVNMLRNRESLLALLRAPDVVQNGRLIPEQEAIMLGLKNAAKEAQRKAENPNYVGMHFVRASLSIEGQPAETIAYIKEFRHTDGNRMEIDRLWSFYHQKIKKEEGPAQRNLRPRKESEPSTNQSIGNAGPEVNPFNGSEKFSTAPDPDKVRTRQAMIESEAAAGKRTLGRPDLANPVDPAAEGGKARRLVDAVDQARTDAGTPEQRADKDVQKQAAMPGDASPSSSRADGLRLTQIRRQNVPRGFQVLAINHLGHGMNVPRAHCDAHRPSTRSRLLRCRSILPTRGKNRPLIGNLVDLGQVFKI